MKRTGRRLRKDMTLGAVLAFALLLLPAKAGAASGTIALAETDSGWTRASLEGAVYRTTECLSFPEGSKPPGPGFPSPEWEPLPAPPEYFSRCAWIPYATLGPVPPEGDCSSRGRRWPTMGDGVQLVWSGGERIGVGSAHFDLHGLELEYGSEAPLLCLSVIEASKEGIVCIQIFPSPCPPYAIVGRHYQLDSTLLEAQPPTPQPPAGPMGAAPEFAAQPAPEQVVGKSRKKRCRKGKPQGGTRPKQSKSGCRRQPRGVRGLGPQN